MIGWLTVYVLKTTFSSSTSLLDSCCQHRLIKLAMTSSNVIGLPLMLVNLSLIELNLSYVSALTLINLEPFGMFKLAHVCL
jgi:hypothetical protein